MTLDEAMALIESEFDCEDGPVRPTGEPYASLCSGGTKAPGEQSPALYATTDGAVKSWLDAVYAHAHDKITYGNSSPRAKLYWRARPELETVTFDQKLVDEKGKTIAVIPSTWYMVYSRLLIVDDVPAAQAAEVTA